MAIQTSELVMLEPLTHSTTQSGGDVSATALDSAADGFFDQVTAGENESGSVEYRCYYLRNNNGSLTLTNPEISFTDASSTLGSEVTLAFGFEGAVDTAATVMDHTGSLPTLNGGGNVVFTARVAGETIPVPFDLATSQYLAVWIRRTTAAATPAKAVSIVLTFSGTTAA